MSSLIRRPDYKQSENKTTCVVHPVHACATNVIACDSLCLGQMPNQMLNRTHQQLVASMIGTHPQLVTMWILNFIVISDIS